MTARARKTTASKPPAAKATVKAVAAPADDESYEDPDWATQEGVDPLDPNVRHHSVNLGLVCPADDTTDWGDDYRRMVHTLDEHPGIRAFAPGQRPATPFNGQVILEQTEPPSLLAYDVDDDEWKPTDQPAPPGGYTHVQTVASTTWTVMHNLGFKPAAFRVVSSTGVTHDPDVVASTTQAAVLVFTEPIAGTADVS